MIDAITGFFRDLVRSCYDVEFYRDVRGGTAGRAFRYLSGLVLLLVLLGFAQLAPAAVRGRDALADTLRRALPDGTVVAMKNGQLETNLPAPFDLGLKGPQGIVDITIVGIEPRDVPAGTLVAGRDAMFFRDQVGETQVAPYDGAPDFTFGKEDVLSRIERFPRGVIVGTVFFLMLPWYAVFLLMTTLSAAFYALLVHWIARLAKAPLRYAQWFAVTCRASTLPLVATALFGDWLMAIPFSRSLLMFLVLAAVVADERARPIGPQSHLAETPPAS